MNHKTLILGLALLSGTALSGCARMIGEEVTDRLAHPVFMKERIIAAGPFHLTAYERMHEREAPATIYIEGDGRAWLSKRVASGDPTPVNPVALHLATRDNSDNVAWLARPCQYTQMADPKAACSADFWKGQRFSPTVLKAYNDALDDIKARWDIKGFNLVGYSGGGAIAAILAGQRSDVLSLRTVAGNLDHKAHSALHNVSPLTASLNPPDYAGTLKAVPQVHFIGGQDSVVPPAILNSYLQALGPSNCVQYRFIQEASHEKGWVDKWPEFLKFTPECKGPKPMDYDFVPMPEPIITAPERPEKP
jgi:hypothetical protein